MSGFWSSTFGGGNSFTESVANTFTPGDGYSYERGELVNDSTGRVMTEAEKTAAGKGSADNVKTNRAAYESRPNVPRAKENPDGSSTDRPVTGIQSLLPVIGGAMLGPVGVAAGLAYNQYGVPQARSQPTNNNGNTVPASSKPSSSNRPQLRPNTLTDAQLKAAREGGAESRIQGAFFKEGTGSGAGAPVFKMNRFGNSYRINPETGNSKLIEDQAAAAGGEGGIAAVRPVGTQVTAPTSTMPAMSDMSREAAAGANMPIPNPNYDPNDPTSMKYIINPSYDQIVAYKRGLPGYTPVEPDSNMSAEMIQAIKNGTLGKVFGYAEGGEVEFALGGNEKDLINAAERAVRNGLQVQGMARGGDMDISNEDKIAIAQYVEQYGKPALMQLVDSVRTGEADETRKRFASGENGEVRGNGDGSGTDDKITAQLKDGDATQDVLLADGEFVLRKDTTEALEKAGVSLNKINDAGPNAAKELSRYMTG